MLSTSKIAVVIPFYQRELGVLSRALLSVAAQDYPKDLLYVIVVDDGSPHSAELEVRLNPAPQSLNLKIIRQENSGPGAARNTALCNLSPGTDIVAFLDSDDEWIGDHLSRAVSCISLGFTGYFSNLFHLGDSVDEYTKARRVAPELHVMVGDDPTLREYAGEMIHQVATANIIFMPTLVISVSALGDVRFPSEFKHGGEDYLYWMELTACGARFAYSTKPEVRCGPGINMWSRSGWGTEGAAKRILDEARFRLYAVQRYAQSSMTAADLRDRIVGLQVSMLLDVAYRLRRRKVVDWSVVRSLFSEMPLSMATAAQITRTVIQRLRK
jgi:succinoglycan biosynthesis protein ExoW